MASNEKNFLCIDIGGDCIKAAEFSHPKEGAILLEKYATLENGLGDLSPDDPGYKTAVLTTVRDIIVNHVFTAKKVYLSLSGQMAFIRFVKVPAMTDDVEKVQKLLEFEAKQNIPFEEDEICYGSQIISTDVENAQVEAMFAIVKNSDVEAVINGVESLRKKVKDVEVASTACYNASSFNGIGSKQCEMILNIGGRSSTLIFADQGNFFVRTFLTAGHAITQQISKEFNISYADAEELKRKHGFVGLGGAYEEPSSEVAATVSKIIRNVMTRLHGEIIRTINVYRANHGKKPEKLYLTGGSSVMTYTPNFFSEKLRIPVEYLNPFQVVAVSPMIDKEELASVAHLFSEVIGLAMRDTVKCPVTISLLPEKRKRHAEMVKKIPFFYASCLLVLFCFSVTYWSCWKQAYQQEELRSQSGVMKKSATAMMKNVQDSFSKLNDVKDRFGKAKGLLANRSRWIHILNEIQKITPEKVWFTYIGGESSVKNITVKTTNREDAEFGGFGGFTESKPQQEQKSEKINYIVMQGHILTLDSEEEGGTKKDKKPDDVYMAFKSSLEKCGLFEKFTIEDDDRMTRNFRAAGSGENVSSFRIEAKLKEPFEQ